MVRTEGDRPVTPGDVRESAAESWESGGIALHRGDVLQLARSLPAASLDAVITDPPYSSGGLTTAERQRDPVEKYAQDGNARGRASFSGDMRDQRSFTWWMTQWLLLCREAAKESAYCLVFTDWRQLPCVSDALQAAGWTWRGVIAWDKGRGSRAPHKGFFRHQCEYLVWGTNGKVPQPLDRGPFDGCYRDSVKKSDKFHLTGKPTPLMRQLVQIVPAGGLILDPFAGSATTLVAAVKEGRRATGFELSPEYFAIGRSRIVEAQAERAAA